MVKINFQESLSEIYCNWQINKQQFFRWILLFCLPSLFQSSEVTKKIKIKHIKE